MYEIEAKNIKKSFGNLEVLKSISLQVNKGEVVAILGSSGSGKSTFLRSLIDLETVDGGSIAIAGESLCKDGVYVSKKPVVTYVDCDQNRIGLFFLIQPH